MNFAGAGIPNPYDYQPPSGLLGHGEGEQERRSYDFLKFEVEILNNGGAAYFTKQEVGNINRKYLHLKTDEYKFVEQATSIFEIYKMFEDVIYGKNCLGAGLITKKGTKDEKPLGIITAWGLPKLKEYLA
jgi:hypothetical protein